MTTKKSPGALLEGEWIPITRVPGACCTLNPAAPKITISINFEGTQALEVTVTGTHCCGVKSFDVYIAISDAQGSQDDAWEIHFHPTQEWGFDMERIYEFGAGKPKSLPRDLVGSSVTVKAVGVSCCGVAGSAAEVRRVI